MIKYLVLFLLLIIYCSCSQTMTSSQEDAYLEGKEYYYNILLKEWLKDANHEELTPTDREGAYVSYEETVDIGRNLLKRHYRLNLMPFPRTVHITGSGAGDRYTSWLLILRVLPKKERLWMLCSTKNGRYVWRKEKRKEMEWETVNMSELRDNNVYTFFLRELELDGVYQCQSTQKLDGPDGNGEVDSARALAIAVATSTDCYGSEMTPVAARLMGNNKEHWLAYCFLTPDNVKLQKAYYDTLVNRYNDGFNLWNWPLVYYVSGDSMGHNLGVVSVLILRKTGQVLFMEKTSENCCYPHDSVGRHIGVPPPPPQRGPDVFR